MNELFIEPIVMGSFGGLTGAPQKTETKESLFGQIFKNAIDDVVSTEKNLQNKEYLLATGQIDDPHSVPVAAAQAQMSVDLLVALRSKALDAYNEMIRLNI